MAVIGGGITGAGVARAAARRGLSVALLEADDFASGTSSKSSKLIHGGLRYLAMGHLGVVRHTARERAVVHRLAPHLCEPHWMVYPVATRRRLALMDVAVRVYEMLGAVEREDRHHRWGPAEVAVNEPALRPDVARRAVVFREYLTDDARLVLANLRDAVAHGATVVSRVPVTTLTGDDRIDGLTARCTLDDRTFRVAARVVVNATGPWVDPVRRLEAGTDSRLVLSRGIHVAVPREVLPVGNPITMTGADGRPVFAIPRGPITYIGTTDARHFDGPTHRPAVTRPDVDYLLDTVAGHFSAGLASGDITGAWAGLRPLIAKPGRSTAELSRKDEVWIGPRGLITVAGGKLTGYLQMADDVLARALEVGGFSPGPEPYDGPLPGGDLDVDLDTAASRLAAAHDLAPAIAGRLVRSYGTEAGTVAGSAPVAEGATLLTGEIDRAVDVDGALSLDDVLVRRTGSAWFDPDIDQLVEPVAAHLAGRLGWSHDEQGSHVTRFRANLSHDLAFVAGGQQKGDG